MSAAIVTCLCGEPLRPEGNFCVRCGRESRQLCPVCFDERRFLATSQPGASSWCETRGEVLAACRRCGRWLTVDTRQCPDPECRGVVGLTWPTSTGRAVDGTGHAESWRWPAVWDRRNPRYKAPRQETWNSEAPVHAAFVTQGRLYVWAETALLAPEGEAGGPLAAPSGQGTQTAWRCWLKLDGQPDPRLPLPQRVALVGGAAVLAAQNGFLLAGLYPHRSDDVFSLNLGTPLAQAASESWWVGWSLQAGRPAVWTAPVPASWRQLDPQQIPDAPAGSVPRENTQIVLRDGTACWIGEDGALWRLDCALRELKPLTEPLVGAQRVWYAPDGTHTVRLTGNGLLVGLDPIDRAHAVREAPGGTGPFRDLFAASALLAVIGEMVTTLDLRTGYTIGVGRYSGQWVAGALTEAQPDAPDQEPRLLTLTYDMGRGNLSALSPSSGGEESVWQAPGVRPLSLIIAGESLYVVHERGVTRIREDNLP
ncbi:MAG: hypothetical protein JWL77_1996 [Chthonomonadaceae bacterium]|nr:hypothetical protein [Chthonomonadaceae bacterium]